uniref:Major facilitator superfamily (MFS) profile domain-containing protein n=1 Tax=Panagrolaimus sp. PS1159 TaxID=55785 RepID=A0AC35FZI7_9BILA
MGALIIESPNNEKYKTTEEVLARLGWKNCKLINIVLSMASIWGLLAVPIMCSAFVVDGIKCPIKNDTRCMAESKRFYSIDKEFGFEAGSFYGGELFLTVFFLGNMVIGTFLSYLADIFGRPDIFGRRKVAIGSLFLGGVFGLLCAFCNSFPLLLVFRFLQGGFFTPASLVNWVLASECISINYHGFASMLFGLWWVVGYCAVAGIAYILPNWQHFMLATSIPTIACAILFWITIPESFQFLIEK